MLTHLRCAAMGLALCACSTSYTLHVQSSAGVSFDASSPLGRDPALDAADTYTPAVRWSAVHDLECPWDSVRVESARAPNFVADGCGHRAVYACPLMRSRSGFAAECQMALVNRFAL